MMVFSISLVEFLLVDFERCLRVYIFTRDISEHGTHGMSKYAVDVTNAVAKSKTISALLYAKSYSPHDL